MSFGEISIHIFLLLGFVPNLASTDNKFYLVETLNNEERTRDELGPRETGVDYSETDEPDDLAKLGVSANDYAELTYAYGALGYDYNSPGKETAIALCLNIGTGEPSPASLLFTSMGILTFIT